MEYLLNYHKDHSSNHKNSHKLCNEKGHPHLSLKVELIFLFFIKNMESTSLITMGSCLSADSASSFGSCLISLMIGSAALSSSFLSAFVSAGLDVG